MKKQGKAVLMDVIGMLQSLVDNNSESEQEESKAIDCQDESMTKEAIEFVKSLREQDIIGLQGVLFSKDDISKVSISGDVLTAMIESFLEKYDK